MHALIRNACGQGSNGLDSDRRQSPGVCTCKETSGSECGVSERGRGRMTSRSPELSAGGRFLVRGMWWTRMHGVWGSAHCRIGRCLTMWQRAFIVDYEKARPTDDCRVHNNALIFSRARKRRVPAPALEMPSCSAISFLRIAVDDLHQQWLAVFCGESIKGTTQHKSLGRGVVIAAFGGNILGRCPGLLPLPAREAPCVIATPDRQFKGALPIYPKVGRRSQMTWCCLSRFSLRSPVPRRLG